MSYLEQLAGRLPKVADDALQSFPLRLISDGVQVHGPWGRGWLWGATWQVLLHLLAPRLTLICAVVEDVEGLHGGRASLLVPKNEVDPLVEVG